jgi:hypothetical protein
MRMTGAGIRRAVIATGIPFVVSVTSCLPDDQTTSTVDTQAVAERLGPGLMARLDSANEAFSADDYETATRLYRSIADEAPDESVGWFGIFMAEQARGNLAAADSALERARKAAPGASLLRPDTSSNPPDGDGSEAP